MRNPLAIKKAKARYYQKHRSQELMRFRTYYQKNRLKLLLKQKIYRNAHRVHINMLKRMNYRTRHNLSREKFRVLP